ncbi:ABC transporter permease [Bacillus marinisedimentorum]|uniref:ABC transporter permease n=1 Tax=Bacillus marinisedimentorum TaxID=1821260 RepID=UPI000872176E|nr:ABC transporter permease [Bacillus marinisedimentorum]
MDGSLFWQRLGKEWKHFSGLMDMIVDRVVAVYIIIPALIVFTANYYLWWKTSPEWIMPVPIDFVWLILYWVVWQGGSRTFLVEADTLFLLQRNDVISGLKLRGAIYSYIRNFAALLFAAGFISPLILVHYGLTLQELMLVIGFLYAVQPLILQVKETRVIPAQGWNKVLLSPAVFGLLFIAVRFGISFTGTAPAFSVAVSAVLFAAGIFAAGKRIREKNTFYRDIMYEQLQTSVLIKLVYQLAGAFSDGMFQAEKPVPARERPLVCRSSGKLYKRRTASNRLSESFIKVFLRSREFMPVYLQFIGLTSAVLVLIKPFAIKMIVWTASFFFLKTGIHDIVRKIAADPFTMMFSSKGYVKAAAALTEKAIGRPVLLITFSAAWFTIIGSWAMFAMAISLAVHFLLLRKM